MGRRRKSTAVAAGAVAAAVLAGSAVAWAVVAPNPDRAKHVFCVDDFNGDVTKLMAAACGPSHTAVTIQSGWRYLGDWNANDVFRFGDVVSYQGGTYLALDTTSSVVPTADQTWARLAAPPSSGPAGERGPQGLPGIRGPQGERGPAGATGAQRWSDSPVLTRSGNGRDSDSLARYDVAVDSMLSGTITAYLPRFADGDTYQCTLRRRVAGRNGDNFQLLTTVQLGPFQRNRGLPVPNLPGGRPLTHMAQSVIPVTTSQAGRVYLKCNITDEAPLMKVRYRTTPIG